MKYLAIRSKLAIWFSAMLMIFLSASFVTIYFMVKGTLIQQSRDDTIRNAVALSGEVSITQGNLTFSLDDAEKELLTAGIIYVLYNHNGLWQDGQKLAWIDDFDLNLTDVRKIVHSGEEWFLFDRQIDAYYDNFLRVLVNNDNDKGLVRVLLPLETVNSTINKILKIGIVAIIPCLVFTIIGGILIAGAALRPIKKITQTTKHIGRGDYTKRITIPNRDDEVGELAHEFNSMIDSVQAAFDREKRFTSNASHEMRTPLAIIIAHTEFALKSVDLETCMESLRMIYNRSKALQKMLSHLLMLARGNEMVQNELIDISAITVDIAQEISAKAADAGIILETNIEQGIVMHMDQMLFTRIIMNILDNSIKYGVRGGFVRLELSKNTTSVLINIRDNGIGISQEDLPYIFDRFYRTKNARTGTNDGAGLGLALVEQAVRLQGGEITAESTLGNGTCFKIIIPLK